MKQKELKNLAKKIAKAEQNLKNTETDEERVRYENEIMKLSGQVKSLEDFLLLDELIQEILKKA